MNLQKAEERKTNRKKNKALVEAGRLVNNGNAWALDGIALVNYYDSKESLSLFDFEQLKAEHIAREEQAKKNKEIKKMALSKLFEIVEKLGYRIKDKEVESDNMMSIYKGAAYAGHIDPYEAAKIVSSDDGLQYFLMRLEQQAKKDQALIDNIAFLKYAEKSGIIEDLQISRYDRASFKHIESGYYLAVNSSLEWDFSEPRSKHKNIVDYLVADRANELYNDEMKKKAKVKILEDVAALGITYKPTKNSYLSFYYRGLKVGQIDDEYDIVREKGNLYGTRATLESYEPSWQIKEIMGEVEKYRRQ